MTNNLPSIRFREFSDGWNFESFSSFATVIKGKFNPLKDTESKKCVELEHLSKGTGQVLGFIDSATQKSTKNSFKKGHVLFGKLRPNLRKYAIAPFEGVCSSEILVLNSTKLKNEFLFNLLSTERFYRASTISSGTKMPRADMDFINAYPFYYPNSVKEQQKIADFLSTVDKKNSLLKEKHALLAQYKKGVMQKLFSQEIRFKDENGNDFPDWKIEPIGKYLEEYKERVTVETDIPILTSSRTGLYLQKRKVINEGEYGVVPKGYFTYRHMSDDLTFKFNLNREWDKGAVSKEYPVFKTVGMNSYFLETCLNEGNDFKRFAIQQKVGGTRTRLYYKNLVTLKLNTPSLDEQNKITDFLQTLDKKIKLVKKQIEQTQTFKKGLLQQMFV